MKVAIFGSYNGTSIGDTAILLGLLRAIGRAIPDARITVLSMGPIDLTRDLSLAGLSIPPRQVRANAWGFQEVPLLRSLLWRIDCWLHFSRRLGKINIGRCRAIFEQQDLLIIGGGNLLMDLFEGHAEVLAMVCDVAREVDVPYVFLGVGAGPIQSEQSRQTLCQCLEHARKVIVRDSASLDICRDTLGRNDTECAPDLAFALRNAAHHVPHGRVLALNLASLGDATWPWRDEAKYRAYLDGFVRLAGAAVQRIRPDHVEIISTNMRIDHRATHDAATALSRGSAALGCPVSVVSCADVTDVLAAFSRAELAITTRLHAGILAVIAGCRVLPVVYDNKVFAVLKEGEICAASVDLASLSDPTWSANGLFDTVANAPAMQPSLIAAEVTETVGAVLECPK